MIIFYKDEINLENPIEKYSRFNKFIVILTRFNVRFIYTLFLY